MLRFSHGIGLLTRLAWPPSLPTPLRFQEWPTQSPSAWWPLTARAVVGWLVLWSCIWLPVLATLSGSPPTDSVEQLIWVRSLEWGYAKHPPLPTFLIWPFVQLFGIHAWVVGIAGAAVISLALLIAWRLVKELAGTHCAALSLLGTLCITYYSGRTNFYNHNTVLLVFVVATAWFCWRAFADRSRRAWWALGVMLGLGALSKYQVVLAALSVIAFWISKRAWRDAIHVRGLLEATGIAMLVVSPHVAWLVTHDFLPFHYANRTSLGTALPCVQRTAHALHWLADQCNRLSPALLLAAGLVWKSRSAPDCRPSSPDAMSCTLHPDAAVFLGVWGLLPLSVVVAIGLVTGANLQFQWGTAFMAFTCASLMTLAWPMIRWERIIRRHAMAGFLWMQALLLAIAWATSPMSGLGWSKSKTAQFDSQGLAAAIGPQARILLGGPVQVIAGPSRVASALAIRLPERPRALLEGDVTVSPWLSKAELEQQGVLWVGTSDALPPDGLEIHWATSGLWWAVQKPQDGGAEPSQ